MTTRKQLKKFFEPALPCKWKVINVILLDLAITLQIIGLVYFVKYAVQAIETNNASLFEFWVWMILASTIIIYFVKLVRKPLVFDVYSSLRTSIDRLYVKKMLYGDNNVYESIGVARISAIYTKGIDVWLNLTVDFSSEIATTLLLFLTFLYTTGSKNPLFIYAIVFLLLFTIFRFYRFGGLAYPHRRKSKDIEIEKQRMKMKWFMSKFEIMQSGKLDMELQQSQNLDTKRYHIKKVEKFYQSVSFDSPVLFVSCLFAVLVRYTGQQVLQGHLLFSDMSGITGIGIIFLKDLEAVLRRFRLMIDKLVDVTRIRDISDEIDKKHHDFLLGETYTSTKKTDIVLKNIDYSYDTSNPIFQDFSLTLQSGKKIALVGPSGGGKSTLIKLIAGYIHPQSGNISVGGQALSGLSLISYYKHLGYLTQEPSVFDGTVKENLEYGVESGKYKLESKELKKVITLSKCGWIYDLKDGLDTEIGERGVRLSGGQKQRLAIAKIMLKNPDIILLDEPTSALDSANEQAVTEALNNLFQGKTVIIIAHRLQTVKHADDIIYISDGKVIERGTHEELLALKGEYYNMVELQSGF